MRNSKQVNEKSNKLQERSGLQKDVHQLIVDFLLNNMRLIRRNLRLTERMHFENSKRVNKKFYPKKKLALRKTLRWARNAKEAEIIFENKQIKMAKQSFEQNQIWHYLIKVFPMVLFRIERQRNILFDSFELRYSDEKEIIDWLKQTNLEYVADLDSFQNTLRSKSYYN